MNFQPLNVQFYGSGCKILNYYNLSHSPAYIFPKDTGDSWLPKSQYSPSLNPPKSNYKYTELYNTREQYIHQSQKIAAPSYSFGKAGMAKDDFYNKTRTKKGKKKYRAKSSKNKNIEFGEEELRGDNCANENMDENNNKKNKNKIKENKEESYHQYYEIGKQFVNKSTQNKAPLYSFARGSFGHNYPTQRRVDNNFSPQNDFYELRKAYIKESKKPRILGYHFGTEKRIDPNIKKKWKYKTYGNKVQKKNNNKNVFKEEQNFKKGDNAGNNGNQEEKKNSPKKNENKEIKFNNSKDQPQDYYLFFNS